MFWIYNPYSKKLDKSHLLIYSCLQEIFKKYDKKMMSLVNTKAIDNNKSRRDHWFRNPSKCV